MSVFHLAAAIVGFLIIAVTLWKLVRHGVARTNGKVDTLDLGTGRNSEWLGDEQ